MQLDGILQPSQHTVLRRMHPTTQLKTSNWHARGTPESRRCTWSTPFPREFSESCVSVMVGSRQPLDYWVTPSSKNISSQPSSDPLDTYIATPWPYPTYSFWLRWRTRTVAASRTTPPTVRSVRLRTGHRIFLFALFIPYSFFLP